MKIIMLIILSLTLTMVSCSKKKGAAAPTADTTSSGGSGGSSGGSGGGSGGGGGSSPTAITYYPADNMKYSPTAINSGKTVSSCSCSPAIAGLTCSVVNSQCILSGTITGSSTQSTTVSATYSDGNPPATSDYTFNYTSTPSVLPAPTITPVSAGNSAVSSSGGATTLTVNSGTTLATPLTFSSDHSVTSCSISPALPAGMTFNTTTCAISGTPSSDISSEVSIPAPGTTYTVTPSNGSTTGTSTSFNLVVPVTSAPTLSAVSSSSVNVTGTPTLTAKAGTAVSMTFSANHKVTSCAITSGTLPSSLSLNSTNCTLSGTPTAADYTTLAGSSFTVTPTGNGGTGAGLAILIKIYKTWCADHVDDGNNSDGIKSGNGSPGTPYILCGKDGLSAMATKVLMGENTKYFKLQSNVNYANSTLSPIAIGISGAEFKGNFDGAGYKISNHLINNGAGGVYGLFYYADSAIIKRIVLDNSKITSPSQGGSVVGNVIGGVTYISDIVIKNSFVDGTSGSSGLIVGLVSAGATLNLTKALVYSSTSPSHSNTNIFVGGVTGTVNYVDAIFEDIQISSGYLNQTGSPSGIHSVSTNDLNTNSSGVAYFGIASSSNWDLTPIKGSGGSPATLIVDEEQVYSDGVVP